MFRYTKAIIVDANPKSALALASILSELPFRRISSYSVAANAWRALKKTRVKSSVQILFLNVNTTDESLRLVARIMSDSDLSHIKVIIVGSGISPQFLTPIFQMGAAAYLSDPFNKRKVNRILNSLVSQVEKAC